MKKMLFIFFCSCICQCCFSQHWQTLGIGLNRSVTSLYSDSVWNKLYIGGTFTRVDGDTTWGITTWNGTTWDSLGHGMDDPSYTNMPANTNSINRFGGYIYAGGAFLRAGNLNTKYLARWNGTLWDSVPGARPNDVVDDIIEYNNELYISGVFDSVGSISAHGIAKWNGSNWQAIGNNYDFNSPCCGIYKMAFYNGNLYVGGFFKDLSGNPCRLAKWDGSAWEFFTNAPQGGIANIWDLVVFNNELYVCGLFYSSDGNAGNSIMRWDDTIWRNVGGGVQTIFNFSPTVCDMCVHNGKLYCAGNFEKIGGISANGVAVWDGTQWCGFGTSFDNNVTQIAFYRDTMYIGGAFSTVDALNISYVAKWIGGNYIDTCGVIATGMNERVQQDFSIDIFPNPISENAIFEINISNPYGEIIITDQLGRAVQQQKVNGEKQIKISVVDLSNGMYFYQYFEKGGRKISGKFLVLH